MQLANGKFLKITEIFAFIAVSPDGEGIMGIEMPGGVIMPMIGANVERVEILKPVADQIAEKFNQKYEIRYFKQDLQ